MSRKGKTLIYSFWIFLTISLAFTYFLYPAYFTPEYLTGFIKKFNNEMLLIYALLSFIRGFFFIPSTPFVIAGSILFPHRLLVVLIISMAGIMISATALYYFSDLLGFSKYLDKKFPEKIARWKSRFENSKSILFVAGWSFFPFVPTDVICYVSGILKTPFKNIFLGIFIGEIILCSIYVYFGASLVALL